MCTPPRQSQIAGGILHPKRCTYSFRQAQYKVLNMDNSTQDVNNALFKVLEQQKVSITSFSAALHTASINTNVHQEKLSESPN